MLEIGKLKVVELREELSKRGLKTAGRKAELAARLQEAIDAEDGGSAQPASEANPTEEAPEEAADPVSSSKKRVAEDDDEETAVKAEPDVAKDDNAEPRAKRAKPAQETEKEKEKEPAEQAASQAEPDVKEEQSEVEATAASSHKADEEASRRPLPDDEDEEEEEYEEVQDIDWSRNCPYLDTINRNRLDFDFEKLCSVSLSNQNVYVCLVCGKYFQGRGKGTHAYMHSLENSHHVFMNLHTLKVYCLPDNYEVVDSSLDDIRFVLRPTFSDKMIRALDSSNKMSRSLDGTPYIPGIVGLNNIKANDYVNVVVQCLNCVPALRNFFLKDENTKRMNDTLLQTLTELFRKVNNPKAFKGHVSPHEFLQIVNIASKRRFKLTEQSDPVDLVSWLLNTINRKLLKHKQTILQDCFRGRMRIASRKLPPNEEMQAITGIKVSPDAKEFQETVSEVPFFFLGVDLPRAPLYQDELRQNMIPQVPLFELLNKFDGVSEHELKTYKDIFIRKFELLELPKYLVLHFKRFTKNNFFIEKNPTIVNFPVKNIDLTEYVDEKCRKPGELYKYDLLCNIVHDGLPKEGGYRAHIYHKASKKWYEVQDLHVADVLPEMIVLSEAYIQIWERQETTVAPTPPAGQDVMDSTPDT